VQHINKLCPLSLRCDCKRHTEVGRTCREHPCESAQVSLAKDDHSSCEFLECVRELTLLQRLLCGDARNVSRQMPEPVFTLKKPSRKRILRCRRRAVSSSIRTRQPRFSNSNESAGALSMSPPNRRPSSVKTHFWRINSVKPPHCRSAGNSTNCTSINSERRM
jgi:hypothetical protein